MYPDDADTNTNTNTNTGMGWWHPYFFTSTADVQLLLPSLTIDPDRPLTLLLALALVFLLCLTDRWAAARTRSADRTSSSYLVYYGLQRASGGSVMLVMMSFNMVLFGATIVGLVLGEALVVVRAERRRGKRACDGGIAGADGGIVVVADFDDDGVSDRPGTYEIVGTMD